MLAPRLKGHLVPVTTEDDKIFLLTESGAHLISGSTERAVLDLLDGQHTIAEIAMELAAGHTLPAVVGAVQKFGRIGLLAEGPAVLTAAQAAYWDAVGVDPALVAERLAARTVRVRTVGAADGSGITRALLESGVRLASPQNDENGDAAGVGDHFLTVVVTDDYLNPELADINKFQHASAGRWIIAKPGGYWAWFGPTFEPGVSACWECLRQRMDSNRMVEQYLHQFGGLIEPVVLGRSSVPASHAAIDAMTALAVVRLIATDSSPNVEGAIMSLDTRSGEMVKHAVARLPQCGVCGDPKIMHGDPRITLEGAPVVFSADGGFRSVTPEATYARLEKHISMISGAVSWLEPLVTDDSGLSYSYSAGHNFAMVRNNMTVLRKNLRGNSGGKGRSDIQAKVSGICEAIERFSGVWSPDRPTLRSRADQLDQRYLLPNELMLFAPEQYQHRRQTNLDPANLLHRVPEPFDPELSIEWTASWSLTNSEVVQVPSAYVWFGHPDCTEHFFTYSDGNGNAAGNTLEEAVLQGFFELVERDAVGLWWYNRTSKPGVDLASFQDPYIDALVEYYRSMDRSLWMLDLTTDLGIPTFASISRRENHPVEDIILAFGSHVDPRLAALRALTETNQFLPAVYGRDELGNTVYLEDDGATLTWWKTATLAENPYLLPDGTAAPVRRDTYEIPQLPTVADHVELCVERARQAGHEVLVVDQSRPDIELRVAKVMAPGLRHFWRRLGAGRLYDLPVAMGELPRANDIADLNPISVFF